MLLVPMVSPCSCSTRWISSRSVAVGYCSITTRTADRVLPAGDCGSSDGRRLTSGTAASRRMRHMLARLTLIPSSPRTIPLSSSSCRSGHSRTFCLTSARARARGLSTSSVLHSSSLSISKQRTAWAKVDIHNQLKTRRKRQHLRRVGDALWRLEKLNVSRRKGFVDLSYNSIYF
jgi:hypothetical protein